MPVMSPDGSVYGPVLEAFGPEILKLDGTIDRKALGALVFSDPLALGRLESLVHPAVIRTVDRMIASSQARVIVVEAIKLLESGMAEDYDAIWVTTCSEATQLGRLVRLRKLSRADALQRISAQPPQADKLSRADVVIDTGGSLAETLAQIQAAWRAIAA